MLRTIAKITGAVWAIIGAYLIVLTIADVSKLPARALESNAIASAVGGAIILQVLMFVFPGLLICILASRSH